MWCLRGGAEVDDGPGRGSTTSEALPRGHGRRRPALRVSVRAAHDGGRTALHNLWITLCENDRDVIHVMWKGGPASTAGTSVSATSRTPGIAVAGRPVMPDVARSSPCCGSDPGRFRPSYRLGEAHRPTASQARMQFLPERSSALDEQRLIDRLVGHRISGSFGYCSANHPEICSGDRRSSSLCSTTLRSRRH